MHLHILPYKVYISGSHTSPPFPQRWCPNLAHFFFATFLTHQSCPHEQSLQYCACLPILQIAATKNTVNISYLPK